MDVEYIKIKSIKPYEGNAKEHPEEQIERIANSIGSFGWQQPIVVDDQGVIIIGHGRYLAAKRLCLDEVPVVRSGNLSPEQVKALRLADNKVAESDWDLDLLNTELDGILDIDMSDFGFDLPDNDDFDFDYEDDRRSSLRHNVFENQERMQFDADNWYGIPTMNPTQTIGDKLLRFCDFNDVDNPSEYIAHFYYDDFKFIQAWKDPDKYIDRLREFKAVVSPDFSLYTDFPRALQILSCYRRQWCGAYWQMQGLDVIPDVVWGDEESFKFCFEGIPTESVVAVSSVGVANDKSWNNKKGDMFKAGFDEMIKRLNPTAIIYYGDMIDGLEGNIIRVPSFYEERRKMLNERER